jgi:hypothetical protein
LLLSVGFGAGAEGLELLLLSVLSVLLSLLLSLLLEPTCSVVVSFFLGKTASSAPDDARFVAGVVLAFAAPEVTAGLLRRAARVARRCAFLSSP